jgi:hypothetical protein
MDGYAGLLDAGVDYIVCDYLAELTMAFLAKDVRGNPEGYSPALLRDFRPWLKRILGNGTKIITNWGGLNARGAGEALQAMAAELASTPGSR